MGRYSKLRRWLDMKMVSNLPLAQRKQQYFKRFCLHTEEYIQGQWNFLTKYM